MHLFSLHYLPQINYLQSLIKADAVCFELEEHFQRQTFRNRCEIYTADGLHKLVVPIDHTAGNKSKSKMRDVRISYADNWRIQHQRTIQSAYQSSTYYEYFETDFIKLFEKKHVFLIDLNLASIEMLLGFLKKAIDFSYTAEYASIPAAAVDDRESFTNNTHSLEFSYYQVFQTKKGFIGNLSAIDLLFNVGPQKMLELINC